LKMELIECSETSAYCNFNQTPGKYPKEYIHLNILLFFLLLFFFLFCASEEATSVNVHHEFYVMIIKQ